MDTPIILAWRPRHRARVDSSAVAAKEVDPARKEGRESCRAARIGRTGGNLGAGAARRGTERAVMPKVSSSPD